MRCQRFLVPVLAIVLLGGTLVCGAEPAPTPDAEKIEKLIAQLGSAVFMERAAASRALEAMGAPALEALRQAASGTEPEARRRAEELVARIERRIQTQQLLKPTTVHLVCRDASVQDAIRQLATKSGYDITLSGDPAKYNGRKVSLDTGEVTFWQALDRLCANAGLCEAESIDLRGRRPAGQVVLTDGKWRDSPVHYSGAARIRCLPPGAQLSGQPQRKGECLFGLGVVLEPRVPLERIGGLRIDKALDDRGQDLPQVMETTGAAAPVAPQVWLVNGPGVPRAQLNIGPQQVAVRLKAGAEPSKLIKEFAGCIVADVRTPPEPVMTVDNLLLAAGKTAKGKDSGSLTVLEVTKLDNGQLRVRVDLQPPSGGNNNGGVRIQQQQAGGGGPAIMRVGDFPAEPMGLSLEDEKGKPFQLVNVPSRRFKIANNIVTHEITLLFQPNEKQGEAAKLHYTSTRVVSVELPFTLKDVPSP
jgi:hypothetical protein